MPNTSTLAGTSTGQNVIFSLKQGSLITLKVAGTSNYLTVEGVSGNQLIIGANPAGGDSSIFQVAAFETDGDSVKVSLQGNGSPYSWSMNGDPNLSNAVGLVSAATPESFLFFPAQGLQSWINIQTAVSPPPPYLQMVVDPTTKINYLAYGFSEPLLQGVFELAIVG